VSYSVDANILIYASDRTSARHEAATEFLQRRAEDPEVFYLAWPVLMAYLRIATHPRIFREPLSPNEAIGNIETLLRLPQVRLLYEEEGFLAVYRQITGQLIVRGNLVPDAHLVALLRQHDVRQLYTTDADFKKFTRLNVLNPFADTSKR
jgi:toxin-antitoxin system PIN domain toxin